MLFRRFLATTFSIALLLPAAIVTSASTGLHLNLRRVASIGLLGVVGTGIAYVLYFRSIAEIGSTRTDSGASHGGSFPS